MQSSPEPETQTRPPRSVRFEPPVPQSHTYDQTDYSSTSSSERARVFVPRGRGPPPSPRRNSGIELLSESDDELYGSSTRYSYTPSRSASSYLSKRSSTTATSGDEGGSDDGAPPEAQAPAGA